MSILDRFMKKVEKTPSCWKWIGSKYVSGYGEFRSGDETRAHRASWSIFRGVIPKGLSVLHKCDIKDCVNPDHLFLGTQKDNVNDMIFKHRKARIVGDDHGMSKLKVGDIFQIREMRKQGLLYKEIAKQFGITPENVGYILRGITWTHI